MLDIFSHLFLFFDVTVMNICHYWMNGWNTFNLFRGDLPCSFREQHYSPVPSSCWEQQMQRPASDNNAKCVLAGLYCVQLDRQRYPAMFAYLPGPRISFFIISSRRTKWPSWMDCVCTHYMFTVLRIYVLLFLYYSDVPFRLCPFQSPRIYMEIALRLCMSPC